MEELLKRNYKEFAFDEPFKYYKPSISPSQIIRKHDNDQEFYLVTLKSKNL